MRKRTNDFLITNDNWAEYTLRYVVAKEGRRKTILFSKILTQIETTNGEVKMASGYIPVSAVQARFQR
jgi:hypothetical protein